MSRNPEPEVLEFRRETVARLTKAGHSAADIAAQLGVTDRTVQRYRNITGASRDRDLYKPMTAEEIATAQALLEDGASYGEVGRTLGRHPGTISHRFPGYGWTLQMGAEYRRAMQELEAIPVVPTVRLTA